MKHGSGFLCAQSGKNKKIIIKETKAISIATDAATTGTSSSECGQVVLCTVSFCIALFWENNKNIHVKLQIFHEKREREREREYHIGF